MKKDWENIVFKNCVTVKIHTFLTCTPLEYRLIFANNHAGLRRFFYMRDFTSFWYILHFFVNRIFYKLNMVITCLQTDYKHSVDNGFILHHNCNNELKIMIERSLTRRGIESFM